MEETKALKEPKTTGIVEPVESIEDIKKKWNKFSQVKKELLSSGDIMTFNGQPYIKESGWRKIATAFNISLRIIERNREEHENSKGKYYVWRYWVEAKAPNGRIQQAEGSCTSQDPFFSQKHGESVEPNESDIIHTAQTCAYNRAISDLVGGGELSAEEMKSLKVEKVKFKEPKPKKTPYINQKQIKKLMTALDKSSIDRPILLDYLQQEYGESYALDKKKNRYSTKLILKKDFNDILEWIESQPKPPKEPLDKEELEEQGIFFEEDKISAKEVVKLNNMFKERNYEPQGIRMVLMRKFNKENIADLTKEEAKIIEEKLEKGTFF